MLAGKIIRKHVAIIHAYSLMSVLQRKVVNVLLSEAITLEVNSDDTDSVMVEHKIPFNKIAKLVNFNSKNTQYLKEAIDGLASLKIEWNLLRDKIPTNISFLNLRVLHGSPTFYQDGTVNYSFHKVMLNLVKSPAIYGTIDLELQSEFESKYGHSLYENSTRFVNLNKGKIIQLDTMRKLLGVQSEKYITLKEVTRNVIKPSVEEVNDRAGFVVSLDSIKSGRKILGYELSVKQKAKLINSRIKQGGEDSPICQEVKNNFPNINENVLNNLPQQYSNEYILEKINYTKNHAKKEKDGSYPIAYFISALKQDYKEALSSVNNDNLQPIDKKPAANEWETKLQDLKTDMNHWKKNLEHAKKSNNKRMLENCKNILLNTEARLKIHLEQKR